MRTIALLALLVLAAAAPLRAQGEAENHRTGGHAGHAGAGLMQDWEEIQDHWGLVRSLSGAEKPEHLEIHRGMLEAFMTGLTAHAAVPGVGPAREGRPPAVGDRMEKADPEAVEGERDAQSETAGDAAEAKGKPGERIEPGRAGEGALSGLTAARDHWKVVEGIEDPAELETHLAMHMDMLEQLMARAPAAKGHEEMKHEDTEGRGEMDHEEMDGGHPHRDDGYRETRARGAAVRA